MKERNKQHHFEPRRPEHWRHHHDEAEFSHGPGHGGGQSHPFHGRGHGNGPEMGPNRRWGGRPGGGGREGGPGGPGGRARRGFMRLLMLDALRDGPKHGYEIAKTIEQRSGGRYVSSPGTIYPTLQHLEDVGFVRAEQQAERRVYHLTDAGRAELELHAQEITAFWNRFAAPEVTTANQTEIGFLQDELELLNRTVWGGLQSALDSNDRDTIRRVREIVEQCRNDIRRLVSEQASGESKTM